MVGDSKKVGKREHLERSSPASALLGSIVILLTGQLTIGLVAVSLFSLSFLLSPLSPLIWAQISAFGIVIVGGLALVALVIWRHRSSFRLPKPGAPKAKASPSPDADS